MAPNGDPALPARPLPPLPFPVCQRPSRHGSRASRPPRERRPDPLAGALTISCRQTKQPPCQPQPAGDSEELLPPGPTGCTTCPADLCRGCRYRRPGVQRRHGASGPGVRGDRWGPVVKRSETVPEGPSRNAPSLISPSSAATNSELATTARRVSRLAACSGRSLQRERNRMIDPVTQIAPQGPGADGHRLRG